MTVISRWGGHNKLEHVLWLLFIWHAGIMRLGRLGLDQVCHCCRVVQLQEHLVGFEAIQYSGLVAQLLYDTNL